MNKLFLITGGNIDDRKKSLETAANLVEKRVGKIINRSKIYETEAWGITDQASFYNQVLVLESKFSARHVLDTILKIEEEMGRKRTVKNAARIIDIDILFFNDEIVNEQNLIIPHPEISNRRFVLSPLNEIAPQMVHPGLKKSMKQLLSETKDQLKAIPVDL
ncbi:MAG: 2-amino-4-hydroxy-6-hydroxymethyldihydropteridine diphosphokinase [Ginsengibacter sp.]